MRHGGWMVLSLLLINSLGMIWAQAGISEVVFLSKPEIKSVYLEPDLTNQGWNLLPEVRFWRQAIRLHPDSCILSVANTREVLFIFPTIWYDTLSRSSQIAFKDSMRRKLSLPASTPLYVTYGKGDYYNIEGSVGAIDGAIPVFKALGVNPWYAQAILLIESPGYSRVSSTGARGPFQLMKGVALRERMTINDSLDQRDELVPSARAAASYLGKVCIPEAKRLMRVRGQAVDPESVWFRLLVLHIYHAGAGNVNGALRKIPRTVTGIHLIKRLWHTHYRGFRNASQNYSQLALAANLEFEAFVKRDANILCYRKKEHSESKWYVIQNSSQVTHAGIGQP